VGLAKQFCVLASLPKMAKAAQNADLKGAFEKHHGETEEQVARLERVFASIDQKPQGKKCAAIEGILDEGKEIMEYRGSPALDAGLISAAQAVEHYETATELSPHGPTNSATVKVPSSSRRRSRNKRTPTRH
jgi:ferritin-like metal-binding protein YciE